MEEDQYYCDNCGLRVYSVDNHVCVEEEDDEDAGYNFDNE